MEFLKKWIPKIFDSVQQVLDMGAKLVGVFDTSELSSERDMLELQLENVNRFLDKYKGREQDLAAVIGDNLLHTLESQLAQANGSLTDIPCTQKLESLRDMADRIQAFICGAVDQLRAVNETLKRLGTLLDRSLLVNVHETVMNGGQHQYFSLLSQALMHGHLNDNQRAVLSASRVRYNISNEMHLNMLRECGWTIERFNASVEPARQARPPSSNGLACLKGFVAKFRKIFTKTGRQCMTIHKAAAEGKTDIVRALLDGRVDVNTKDEANENTPLHYAASGGHTAIAQLLIDKGADVNVRDKVSACMFFV
eukprot:GDKI01034420.1.p1 GENE.GDKI01034420.1~~GDKI01034420.1.p1  ORF type:complete len:310 (+),score=64.86 GDKI01034420.1:218-1147(+)